MTPNAKAKRIDKRRRLWRGRLSRLALMLPAVPRPPQGFAKPTPERIVPAVPHHAQSGDHSAPACGCAMMFTSVPRPRRTSRRRARRCPDWAERRWHQHVPAGCTVGTNQLSQQVPQAATRAETCNHQHVLAYSSQTIICPCWGEPNQAISTIRSAACLVHTNFQDVTYKVARALKYERASTTRPIARFTHTSSP